MFYYLLSLYWAAQAFFVAPQPANLQPVEGFVRHAETAAALPGVVVRAMRLHVAVDSTRSDSAGRYRLALEPGRYDLEWSLAGFVTQRVSRSLPNRTYLQQELHLLFSNLKLRGGFKTK